MSYLINNNIQFMQTYYRLSSKCFWSLISSINKNFVKSSEPQLTDSHGNNVFDPVEKAKLFTSVFASNSLLEDYDLEPPIASPCGYKMPPITIDHSNLFAVINGLDANKAAGPDEIPPIVIKKSVFTLLNPLCSISLTCIFIENVSIVLACC